MFGLCVDAFRSSYSIKPQSSMPPLRPLPRLLTPTKPARLSYHDRASARTPARRKRTCSIPARNTPKPKNRNQRMLTQKTAEPQPPPAALFVPDPDNPPQEPYFVRRTFNHNLPVYHETKRGGNLRLTVIRKVEGRIGVLRDHLPQALGLDPKLVKMNTLTRQVIIKVSAIERGRF